MPDPYSGMIGKQEKRNQDEVLERERQRKLKEIQEKKAKKAQKPISPDKKGKKTEKKPFRVGETYQKGIEAMRQRHYIVELDDMGPHVNHKIYKHLPPPIVKGVNYPKEFMPCQEIVKESEFDQIETLFMMEEEEVKSFWEPIYYPRAGDNQLKSFVERKLSMARLQQAKNLTETLEYGHSFDPSGSMGGEPAWNPRIWVPDRDWFCPRLHAVQFSDIFTIFPPAEREILKLLIGRIGVGRSNHLPPNWKEPVDHTARMAAIVVGKDPGLGKSTLFNGFLNAITQCGFKYSTFRSTEDRFGMQEPALADVAYKDDTALHSLKKLISSEETKILITNGLLQTEEKFARATQIWPKAVLIVNANDWNANFAYDIDPGIQDRIKLVSTYREAEVHKLRSSLSPNSASYGSPDLRPRAHIPFLAEKFGVSQEAIYLWALRLATDRFWEVISDKSDPTINRLQVEVRYWTSRLRIRFRSDVTQALVNAIAFAYALRTGKKAIPELTPDLLLDGLQHFYFVGVDPSCQEISEAMKKSWEKVGRTSTHYYQGFREIRWESVKKALEISSVMGKFPVNSTDQIKKIIELLVMRDGFKMGGGAQYIIENWDNMRFAYDDTLAQAEELAAQLSPDILERVRRVSIPTEDSWMEAEDYSPDRAEEFRTLALKELREGGKMPVNA